VAAGDAHRVCFPEMVEHLRLRWRDDLSMEALLRLRDELDDMLGRIRSTRHISNPVFKCPACGHIGRGADPQISVRATILALARFGVAAREPARALEKPGVPTEMRRDLICMATPRRENRSTPKVGPCR
jgi:hypothetical protein